MRLLWGVILMLVVCEFSREAFAVSDLCENAVGIYFPTEKLDKNSKEARSIPMISIFSGSAIHDYGVYKQHLAALKFVNTIYTPSSVSQMIADIKQKNQFTVLMQLEKVPSEGGRLFSIGGAEEFPDSANMFVDQVGSDGSVLVRFRSTSNRKGEFVKANKALNKKTKNSLFVSFDGSVLTIGVNGGILKTQRIYGTNAGSLSTWNQAYSLFVGGFVDSSKHWGGHVTGLVVWSRALSIEEAEVVSKNLQLMKGCDSNYQVPAEDQKRLQSLESAYSFRSRGGDEEDGGHGGHGHGSGSSEEDDGDSSGSSEEDDGDGSSHGSGSSDSEEDDDECERNEDCLPSPCQVPKCRKGECVYYDLECDDSDICTTDSCNSETGVCVNELIDLLCDQEKNFVVPILECVEDIGGGDFIGHFGYENMFYTQIMIQAGTNKNKFVPNPKNRGQPSAFAPGLHEDVFQVQFSGAGVTWRIKSPDGTTRTASASSESESCTIPPPPPECTTNEDCTASDPCHLALCVAEECTSVLVPSCTSTNSFCTLNIDCNDGEECTRDICFLNQCYYIDDEEDDCEPSVPCTSDQSCDDSDPCTIDQCVAGKCSNVQRLNCVTDLGECVDDSQCFQHYGPCRRSLCDTSESQCYSFEIFNCEHDTPDCIGRERVFVNFEQWATGSYMKMQYYPVFILNNPAGSFPMMIFNSSNPTGGDFDLGTPNQAHGGPGVGAGGVVSNTRPLKQLLIISEDGDQSNPDDSGGGGPFNYTFQCPTYVEKTLFIDLDSNFDFWEVKNGNAIVKTGTMQNVGNNGVEELSFLPGGYGDSLSINFADSGAQDEFYICTQACTFTTTSSGCDGAGGDFDRCGVCNGDGSSCPPGSSPPSDPGCDGIGGQFDRCGVCGGDNSTCPDLECCDYVNVTQTSNVVCSVESVDGVDFRFTASLLYGSQYGIPVENAAAIVDFEEYSRDLRRRGSCGNRVSDIAGPWSSLWTTAFPPNGWTPTVSGSSQSTWANYTRVFSLADLQQCENFAGNSLITVSQQLNHIAVEGNMWMTIAFPANISDENQSPGELVAYSFPCQFNLEFGNGGTVSTQFDTEKIGFHIVYVETFCTVSDVFVVQFQTEINEVEPATLLVNATIQSQVGYPTMELVSGTLCQPLSPAGRCRQTWTLQSVALVTPNQLVDVKMNIVWQISTGGEIRTLEVNGDFKIKSDNPCANIIDIDNAIEAGITLYKKDDFLDEYVFGEHVFLDCDNVCGIVAVTLPENSCNSLDLDIHRITICASDQAAIPPFDPLDPLNTGCNAPVPGIVSFVVYDKPTNWFGGVFWQTQIPLPTPSECVNEEGFCFQAHRLTPGNAPITVQATWTAEIANKKRAAPVLLGRHVRKMTVSYQIPHESQTTLETLLNEIPEHIVQNGALISASHGKRSLHMTSRRPMHQFEVRCPPQQQWDPESYGDYGCHVQPYHQETVHPPHFSWFWWFLWWFFCLCIICFCIPCCVYKCCYGCRKGRSYDGCKKKCAVVYAKKNCVVRKPYCPPSRCTPVNKHPVRSCTKSPYVQEKASSTSIVIPNLQHGYKKKKKRTKKRTGNGMTTGVLYLDLNQK